jgi:hypothetical protein
MKAKSFVLTFLLSVLLTMTSCNTGGETPISGDTSTQETSETNTSSHESSEDITSKDTQPSANKYVAKAVDTSNSMIVTTNLEQGAELSAGPATITLIGGTLLEMPTYGGPGFSEKNIDRIFVSINGVDYRITSLPTVEAGETINQVEVNVIIPEEDFNVFVHYQIVAQSDEGHYVSVVEGGEHAHIIGLDLKAKYPYISTFVAVDDGYLIEEAFYRFVGNENWNPLKVTLRPTFTATYYVLVIGNGGNHIQGDVEIKFVTGQHQKYNINYVIDSALTINQDTSTMPEFAFDSTTVTLNVYLVNSASFVVSSDDCEITGSSGYYTFVMPAKDITINIKEKEADVTLSVTENPNITKAYFLNEDDVFGVLSPITKGVSGTTVYLVVVSNSSYKPTGGTAGNGTLSFRYKGTGDKEDSYIYTAPIYLEEGTKEITANVITTATYVVTVDENGIPAEATITVATPHLYAPGEIVKVTFDVTSYNLVIKTAVDGEVLDLEQSNITGKDGAITGRSFVMPDRNVFVTLTVIGG